jgi:hypothetical protein
MEQQALTINPLAVLLLVAAVVVALTFNRQNAVKALLASSVFIPSGQQFVIFGVHFHFFRIVLAAGLLRVIVRQDFAGFRFNPLDKFYLAWGLVGMLCESLHGQTQNATGGFYNAVGTYFLVRCLITDVADVAGQLKFLAWVVFGVALCMLVEFSLRHNPFAVFGGVLDVPEIRAGRVRCQGPFRSSNVAGAFGATLFPLMVGLWFSGRENKRAAALGVLGCAAATFFCNSSSPYICVMIALVGFALWNIRGRMSLVRRGLVLALIVLAVVMKAPVWYVVAKIGDFSGGNAWHRAFIIDLFIHHFDSWWLMGTWHTVDWSPHFTRLAIDPNQLDITNQYVEQGIEGGVWKLLLFIAVLVAGFKIIGQALDSAGRVPLNPKLIWALGVGLAAHCACFFSICYFDQIQVYWFWFVAILGSLSAYLLRPDETSTADASADDLAPVPVDDGIEPLHAPN